MRQWIVSTLGDRPDGRRRSEEFAETGPIPSAELRALLVDTMAEARQVVSALAPDSLLGMRRVQGFEESALSILVHVVEHFAYHTGQVAWIVKAQRETDLGFYRGVDLERHG